MLKSNLDAPSQSIKSTDGRKRIFLAIERRDDDDPFRRDQCLGHHGAALVARLTLDLFNREIACLLGLADSHQTQFYRLFCRGLDNDRLVDQSLAAALLEKCDEIEALAGRIEPAGRVPLGAGDDVGAGIKHPRDPVSLQIGTIANTDFTRDNIGSIDDLGLTFICEVEGREAFACQIKYRMDAPPAARFPGTSTGLRYRRGIDKTYRPTLSHRQAGGARGCDKPADQPLQPVG